MSTRPVRLLIRLGLLVALGGILSVVGGCGSKPLHVEGNVTFDGKPLSEGAISFEPASGPGRDFGGVIKDGKYQIASPPGMTGGPMVVRIRGAIKTGKQIPAGSPAPPGTMVDEVFPIPARYNDKSTLKADLQPGKNNQCNFELHSDKAP